MQRIDVSQRPGIPHGDRPRRVAGTRAAAVPIAAFAGAFVGVVGGWTVGDALLKNEVIQPGTSSNMAPAVVAAVGGGLGWLLPALVVMIVYRKARAPTPGEAQALISTTVVIVCVGVLAAAFPATFEDRWKDPRMFRLQLLIWLDAGLAAATCLIAAQRRWKPSTTIGLITAAGFVFLAVAASQFLPFLAACAPIPGGSGCRAGF